MWSVGISVAESEDAARFGYGQRQINRIVIRLSRYFLGQNMRIIFGHDWREDGVMQAIANYAELIASHFDPFDNHTPQGESFGIEKLVNARMINVAPFHVSELSRAALSAEDYSGGIFKVISCNEVAQYLSNRVRCDVSSLSGNSNCETSLQLTALRHCLTAMLAPGCRICLGGGTCGFQGSEPDLIEEARLALTYEKPLYLMGGFGGATRLFGMSAKYGGRSYWQKDNGLTKEDKETLFQTMDIEKALRLILRGINQFSQSSARGR